MSLKPVNLVQAAAADLKRRADNRARDRGELSSAMEHYAYLGQHVRIARDKFHLVRLAYNYARRRTVKCAKKSTRLIYSDSALLGEALKLGAGEDGQRSSTCRSRREADAHHGGD